jgi:hypothetical protein
MNYIHHLNTFLWLLQRESRLTPSHISLYLALFHYWNCNRFQNPFPLFREKLMQISGIGSKNTYSRCLKDLHEFGYIRYDPSLHKNHRPKVSLLRWKNNGEVNRQLSIFQQSPPENAPLTVPDMGALLARIGTLTDPDPVKSTVKSGQDSGPDLSPNNKLDSNNETVESEAHAPDLSAKDTSGENTNQATSRAAAPAAGAPPPSVPSSKAEVIQYFATIQHAENEALKFFAHYQANGWQQGGNVPITDWQAAADKWVLNSFGNKQFHDNKTNPNARTKSDQLLGQHKVNQNKDYNQRF